MKHIFIIISLVCLTHCAFSASLPQKFSPREQQWIMAGLSPDFVKAYLAKAALHFEKGKNGESISAPVATIYLNYVKSFQSYYFFEYDTKFSRSWIDSSLKFIEALITSRQKIEEFEVNQKTDTKEYKQWEAYYKQTAKQFAALVKNPQKASDSAKLKELGQQKKALVEAMLKQQQEQGAGKKIDLKKK